MMEKEWDFKQKAAKLFQGKNATRILFLIGILGIVLIFLSSLSSGKNEKAAAASAPSILSSEEYTKKLEEKIEEIAERINGVGEVDVMVTLENGVEYVYANSEKKTTDNTRDYDEGENKKATDKNSTENDVILIDGQDGKEALVVTELEPTVKGVVVVCDGGDNIQVIQNLTDAITTALHLSSNRVSIVKSAT